jgi:diketogulonate reductase-like aldo/keto reductase
LLLLLLSLSARLTAVPSTGQHGSVAPSISCSGSLQHGTAALPGPPPALIFGTAWQRGNTATNAHSALALGFRALDTANQPRHYDENALGSVLRDAFRAQSQGGLGLRRAQLWVQTKFTHASGHHMHHRGADDYNSSSSPPRMPYPADRPVREQVRLSLRSSLEHLGLEWIDALLLHAPVGCGSDLGSADLQAWVAMEQLVIEG